MTNDQSAPRPGAFTDEQVQQIRAVVRQEIATALFQVVASAEHHDGYDVDRLDSAALEQIRIVARDVAQDIRTHPGECTRHFFWGAGTSISDCQVCGTPYDPSISGWFSESVPFYPANPFDQENSRG